MVDTNDEWIRDRVGIAERRIADSETVADMATFAAEKALAALRADRRRHRPGDRGDLLLDRPLPERRHPGRRPARASPRPAAFDLNTACSGFSYALGTADHAIRAGAARNALVIGAEKLSDVTDWTDRSTAVLFGDGAGAAVVTAVADGEQPGIGPVRLGLGAGQGRRAPHRGLAAVHRAGGPDGLPLGHHRARPARARRPASGPASRPAELAAFVPHQANTRIIDGIVKRLGLGPDVVIAKDIVESGNTSAASVPLALSKLVERREVPSGAPVLLFGFGGGLTYAGQVVRCP